MTPDTSQIKVRGQPTFLSTCRACGPLSPSFSAFPGLHGWFSEPHPQIRTSWVVWLLPGEQEEEMVPPTLVLKLYARGKAPLGEHWGLRKSPAGPRCRALWEEGQRPGPAPSQLLVGEPGLDQDVYQRNKVPFVLTHALTQPFSLRCFISSAAASPRSGVMLMLTRGGAGWASPPDGDIRGPSRAPVHSRLPPPEAVSLLSRLMSL